MSYNVGRIALVAPLAIIVAALAACGDNGDGDRAAATPTPARGDAEEPTPVLEGIAAEFRRLQLSGPDATFKVTYRITTDEGLRTVVVYQRPPRTRIDSTEPDGTASILIGGDRETRTIACAGGPDAWRCAEIEPLGESLLRAAGPALFLEPASLVLFQVQEIESRIIAGQQSRCFQLASEDEPAYVLEYCMTAEGVTLYNAPLFGTVEALEFSTEVSDDDFAPPAQVE